MLKNDEIKTIEREIYNISLYIILYLNSGCVISRAFDKLIDKMSAENTICEKLFCFMKRDSLAKNISFESELFYISKELKSKEFIRFAAIVNDNKDKGSGLSDKLEKERSRMQSERLNEAKAIAKKTDTKLCFPLMLLLVSLVLICIAPAVITM